MEEREGGTRICWGVYLEQETNVHNLRASNDAEGTLSVILTLEHFTMPSHLLFSWSQINHIFYTDSQDYCIENTLLYIFL